MRADEIRMNHALAELRLSSPELHKIIEPLILWLRQHHHGALGVSLSAPDSPSAAP